MAVLIPRIRTINVRLSEEEYLELERFCAASGARSISDLVRNTMNNLVRAGHQENSLASSVNEYSTHVRDLELRVKELAAELASLRTDVQPHHAEGAHEIPDETTSQSSSQNPNPTNETAEP